MSDTVRSPTLRAHCAQLLYFYGSHGTTNHLSNRWVAGDAAADSPRFSCRNRSLIEITTPIRSL